MAGGEGEIIVLFQNFRFFLLDLCVGTAPQNMGTAPRFWGELPIFWGELPIFWGELPIFWGALPLCGDKTFPKYV